MEYDLTRNVDVVSELGMADRDGSATFNGVGIDTNEFESIVFLCCLFDNFSGDQLTFNVQDSDDNSTFALIADDELFGTNGTFVADNANRMMRLGAIATRRYIRISLTIIGNSGPNRTAAYAVTHNHKHTPRAETPEP